MTSEPVGRQNGLAIRALRRKDRISTRDLADQVGLHEQALRNIENGTRPASDEVIYALARALGVLPGAITRDAKGVAA